MERNSNLEMLRIIAMLAIIAYHLGTHGFLYRMDDLARDYMTYSPYTFNWNIVFTQLASWGGTFGNSIFMLITGYFMITRTVNYRKIFELVIKMFIYTWGISIIFYLLEIPGFQEGLSKNLLLPIWFWCNNWFVQCYIIIALLSPFINEFLNTVAQKKYQQLLSMLVLFYIIMPMLGGIDFLVCRFNFFLLMYMIGGYISLYKLNQSKYNWCKISVVLFLTILSSIIIIDVIGYYYFPMKNINIAYKFVQAISYFLAISIFCTVLNKKSYVNRWINHVASSLLGVYLIHEHPMIFHNLATYTWTQIDMMQSKIYPLLFISKVVCVFCICVLIDNLVSYIIKKFIFKRINEMYLWCASRIGS